MRLPAPHRANGAGNIAVPFTESPAAGELATLTEQGADIFELRLDLIASATPQQAGKIASAFAGFPLIATARSIAEGGRNCAGQERVGLLAAAAEHAWAIDIELASRDLHEAVAKLAAEHNCDLIVSSHHFDATPDPEKLTRLAQNAFAIGADVFKIACQVASQADVNNLADLIAAGGKDSQRIAAMGMGDSELARQSRVQLAKAGSLFVFASARNATAAGQPSLQWLARQLAN